MLERRALGRGIAALVSRPLEAAGFLIAFTERTGGTSQSPFRSLNLGLRTDDERAAVLQNRRRVCEALGVSSFAVGQQVNGARCARVGPKRAGAGFTDAADAFGATDALITTSRDVALAALVADCVPVALVDPARGALAVVHAGWRGIAAGILGASLRRFAEPGEVRAVIGPAIGPDHYSVGEDVALAVSAASDAGVNAARRGGQVFLDLPGTVARILKELGVRREDSAGTCTACEPRRFFSYRRDGPTGRQALIAVRLG